ncbi:hypothetical protein [Streptomyces sp. NPDC001380]|uniref:hypothetical protein n=1 Tax=Streptomyces sp. NPDC001380 TaxID=3364566 RepID=UPI0036737A21
MPHVPHAARHVPPAVRARLLPDDDGLRTDRDHTTGGDTGLIAGDPPAPLSPVSGLRRDQDAVVAGLSGSWGPGRVEGRAPRIELIGQKGCGRAGLGLLRGRALLTA